MKKHCLHCAVGLRFSSFVCNSSMGPKLKMREQCLTLQNALPKRTLKKRDYFDINLIIYETIKETIYL